jgi:hypothetical protein
MGLDLIFKLRENKTHEGISSFRSGISSGYWVVDGEGYAQGPYDTVKDAEDDIPPTADLQYPLLSSE